MLDAVIRRLDVSTFRRIDDMELTADAPLQASKHALHHDKPAGQTNQQALRNRRLCEEVVKLSVLKLDSGGC